jgi:hypothetical protein
MKKVLNFFRNRSILFYIFWSSFLIGESVHLVILRECSGTLFRSDHIVARYASQIIHCNPVKIPFVEICQFIYIYSFVAYLVWYVFKFFRFLFRLGFK